MSEFTPGKENLQEYAEYVLGIVPESRKPMQNELPLHIAVLPPFYNLLNNEEKLVRLIEECCSEIPILCVGVSYEPDDFSNGRIVHYQFNGWTTQQIEEVHNFILNKLLPATGVNREFIGRKYDPHILVTSVHSRPGRTPTHKGLNYSSFLCSGLELWKKGGVNKDWTNVTKFSFMSGCFVDGNHFNILPLGLDKYKHFEWSKAERNKKFI